MKNKSVAATLALLMGIFGVHRFYLGQRFLGIVYLFLFFFTFTISVEEEAPFILAPALLGFIDAILLFVMPKEEFDEKYNKKYVAHHGYSGSRREDYRYQPSRSYERRTEEQWKTPASKASEFKRLGVGLFREMNFDGAVDAFERALDEKFDDSSTHFNLACAYSMLQEAEPAFYHLEKAVEFGFTNLEKIHRHDALSFLRAQPYFDDFVRNGYRELEALPSAGTPLDQPTENKSETDDLLQQIIKLGDLRDKGILTEQEFVKQKRKILGEE